MGNRARDWYRTVKRMLTTTQAHILGEASYSCIDDTGLLAWTRSRLADECRMSLRTLERHLPQLEKLGYLMSTGEGFRLAAFVERDRQIGGQIVRQNDRQNGGASRDLLGSTGINPPTPLPGGRQKPTREERRRARAARDFDEPQPHGLPFTHGCDWCSPPHRWECAEPACVQGFECVCDVALGRYRAVKAGTI